MNLPAYLPTTVLLWLLLVLISPLIPETLLWGIPLLLLLWYCGVLLIGMLLILAVLRDAGP